MIDDRLRFTTGFGGVISLIVVTIIIIFAWLFGKDMIYKENPKLIIKDDILPYFPVVNLNYTYFFFAFRVEDENGNLIPEYYKYIDFEIVYAVYDKSLNSTNTTWQVTNETKIPLSYCDFYYDYFPNFFSKDDLQNNLFCIKDMNLDFGGSCDGTHMRLMHVNLNLCKNSTDENYTCAAEEEIYKVLPGKLFSVYYSDLLVDPKNYENPVRYYLNFFYQVIDPKLYKAIDFFMQSLHIETDNGYFTSDISNQTQVAFNRMAVDTSTLTNIIKL